MKRILAMVMLLTVLFCAVPVEAAEMTDAMKIANDSDYEWYEACIDALLEMHDQDGNNSDTLVVCLHYYLDMYTASEQLKSALMKLPYSRHLKTDASLTDAEKAAVVISDFYGDAYREYLNGEITAKEYVGRVRTLYEVKRDARKEVEEKLKHLQ